jgi:LemA protein
MDFSTIILIVLVITVFWFIFAYNRFVRLVNRTKEAWSDIEVQMKRRYDLIPNLVRTVKGYAEHESGTLDKVIKARNLAMNAKTTAEHAEAENALSSTLKSIFALSESYPDLKANTKLIL